MVVSPEYGPQIKTKQNKIKGKKRQKRSLPRVRRSFFSEKTLLGKENR